MIEQAKVFDRQYVAGILCTITVAAAASCFGWTAPIMKYLMDEENPMYMTSSQISWMIAIIEVGNLLSPLPAGALADRCGRKITLLLTGPMLAVSWLIILYTTSYVVICIMRILQGLAMGIVFTVVPLYLGEISSRSKRGSVTGFFSGAWFFGYLIEYCVGPYVTYRIFTAITATVPVMFFVLFCTQPESPYYLLMKGDEEKAAAVLGWLRGGRAREKIQNELDEIKRMVLEDQKDPSSISDVIDSPADRRALLIVFLIGSIRILSGAIAIMSYSTDLFTESKVRYISPDTLTIIMGCVMFFGGFVNTFVVDRLGRRPLIFLSCVGCFFSMLVVGCYFYVEAHVTVTADVSRYSWLIPSAIMCYCLFSVVGIYPVSMTYTSELFTTKTRGTAASLSAINLTIGSFICIKLYQIVGDSYGLYTVYWFFSAVCLVGLVLLYILAPETKGKTFAQIRSDLCEVTGDKSSVVVDDVTTDKRPVVVDDVNPALNDQGVDNAYYVV